MVVMTRMAVPSPDRQRLYAELTMPQAVTAACSADTAGPNRPESIASG